MNVGGIFFLEYLLVIRKEYKNLNCLNENLLMNVIEPLGTEAMSPSYSLIPITFSFVTSTCIAGWYLYYLYNKSEVNEKRLDATVEKVRDILDIQDLQSEALDEFNTRVCEKKDYDDSEEIDEGKYQSWKGTYASETIELTVAITREKESTIKKNQEWTSWNSTPDGSCTVRDFYLGNSHPDFSWDVQVDTDTMYEASVSDTLINGWDSVIKVTIQMKTTRENLLSLTSSQFYNGSPTLNAALKKILDANSIQWSKVLLDV